VYIRVNHSESPTLLSAHILPFFLLLLIVIAVPGISYTDSLLQLVPLVLIWMLPDTKAEQRKLIDDGEKSELYGGILTITVLVSLVAVIVVSVVLIWYPVGDE
jgi:hypothetical protein